MVAMNVWPTDAADGSVSNEARWRKMARYWAPTGVAAGQGSDMLPTLAYPNLTVKAGACWVDGHYCELPGDQVLAVTPNGLAVVRLDPAANTAQLLYLDGVSVPAQSPTGVYELPIAKITGSALVDQRSVATPGGPRVLVNAVINTFISNIGGGGTVADLPGFAGTINAVAGRTYRVDWYFISAQNGVAGQQTFRLYDNGGLVNVIAQMNIITLNAYTVWSGFYNLPALSSGSHALKLTGTADTGAATLTVMNTPVPGRFTITDIGPTN